jgi:hypothetical protein
LHFPISEEVRPEDESENPPEAVYGFEGNNARGGKRNFKGVREIWLCAKQKFGTVICGERDRDAFTSFLGVFREAMGIARAFRGKNKATRENS